MPSAPEGNKMDEATRNYPLEDIDRETMFHPNTSIVDHLKKGPHILAQARGVRIKEHGGRELIDCGAGLWCVNIGYGRKEMAEAAKKAIENLAYYHIFGGASNEPIIRLAERVLRLFHEKANAPHLSKVFFGSGGSDANDTNFKLVRYYNNLRGKPEKKKIISRLGAYHGLTYAAASLTGIPVYHKAFDLPVPGVLHTSCPHYFRYATKGESEAAFSDRMVAEVEALIAKEGAETVAAFIAEPIMGTGGVLLPPKGYFEKLQKVFDKHDILFIADEVITGFGRTGHWFATGGMKLKPDIVTLAKGITSAYFPVSASVISEKIWNVLKDASPEFGPVMHGFTYSGHPVGGALGLVNIDIMEREGLVQQAAEVGSYLQKLLADRLGGHPHVGEVRGMGQMIAVEFVADKATRRFFDPKASAHRLVAAKALELGVLTRALPFIEVNSFSPPLSMTRSEAEEAVEIYGKALDAVTPELARLAGRT
jgi:L-2,4-diaminobutyrate transaminase